METFPLFPLYGDFTGNLLYGDFSSLWGLFSSLRGLYGDSSLWRLFLFFFFTGTFFLFTGTLRGLFSMETFPLFPLYGDFTGSLLYGDFSSFSSLRRLFSSLRGLYGDSSLWRLFLFFLFTGTFFPLYRDFKGDFTGTLLYGDFSSFSSLRGLFSSLRGLYGDSSLWRLFLFFLFTETFSSLRGTLRGLFSMETFHLFPLYGDFFPLYGDFTGTLLYGDFSSLRGLFSSLRGVYGNFTGTLLYRNFSSLSSLRGLFFLFTGTLRGLYGDSSL